jgi:hypothetical protein
MLRAYRNWTNLHLRVRLVLRVLRKFAYTQGDIKKLFFTSTGILPQSEKHFAGVTRQVLEFEIESENR